MSTQHEETWSKDKESFSYDSLGELLDNFGDQLNVGDVVYVGEAHRPTASDFVDTSTVIDDIAAKGDDIGGEYADDFPTVSAEAETELADLLQAWIDKHLIPVRFYQVLNIREHILTEEDFKAREPA